MKFFVDTADIKEIRELNELGLLDGVTTNPSLILKSGGKIAEVTKQICDIVDDNIHRLFQQYYSKCLEDGNQRRLDPKTGWFLKPHYRRLHNLLKDKHKLGE